MEYIRILKYLVQKNVSSVFSGKSQQKLNSVDMDGIVNFLAETNEVIVMTGAGISTNANIPDFRSESFGLYNRLQKYNLPHTTAVFTLKYFKENPAPFYDIAHEMYPVLQNAKPTITHYFIKLLDQKGKLLKHYTQNIDCLEELAGLEGKKTVQAHGHIKTGTCLGCQKSFDFKFLKDKVIKNEIPRCNECSETIKPDVVLFGESLPKEFWNFTSDFSKCKLLIIIGTSLAVQPFAGLAGQVDLNCPRVLINRDQIGDSEMLGSFLTNLFHLNPEFGSTSNTHRDVFLEGDCDKICLQLAEKLGWKEELLKLMDENNRNIEEKKSKI
ncbi:NAD-dependent deacetylase Sirt2 isoform X3 [Brachionus plicatilis]|uniref:NAD-dependent protein deacetylase n=1 Tax=Brachionus plicatilis TaxID=10195 RepID=A0A3M7Q7M2_BRAPC|nr:NAD-dependent deacetylase Sirt2 isoform X3 [Brachionus plicatilis]